MITCSNRKQLLFGERKIPPVISLRKDKTLFNLLALLTRLIITARSAERKNKYLKTAQLCAVFLFPLYNDKYNNSPEADL